MCKKISVPLFLFFFNHTTLHLIVKYHLAHQDFNSHTIKKKSLKKVPKAMLTRVQI
jgi:hypothetical protein